MPAVMRALWGTKRALRSKEIVMSVLVPGHLVDPRQVSVYQCLCTMRRFVLKRPDLHAMMLRCWQAYSHNCVAAPGPVGLVAKMVAQIGWVWDDFYHFSGPGRSKLPLASGPDSWWQHELRHGLQLARWRAAPESRQDMRGLDAPQGLDCQATLSYLNSKIDPREAGMLRGILSGSIRLQKRLYEASLVDSAICPFCGMAEETVEHCIWDCPCWQDVRDRFQLPAASVVAQWPACTKSCGLFLEDPCVIDLCSQLEQEAAASSNLLEYFDCARIRNHVLAMFNLHEEQIVWTDGASSHN